MIEMIKETDLTMAGIFTKPHGLRGELNAKLDIDSAFFDENEVVVCIEEGIPTPFFIESFRSKGFSSSLIKLDGVDSEEAARGFAEKNFYVDKSVYRQFCDENTDGDGEYASDLIGWKIVDIGSEKEIGVIDSVNIDTDNPLFYVMSEAGSMIFIPIAEEFIRELNEDDKVIKMFLPDGLIDLNA